ncbi:unnamed protein product [Penicillium camemberti]|uniref:Str. FM013 n=1 Tax=Penicillium camemberti (strain FM 013) TaxID=1429867 RepID=A0A0G4PAR2_PENC3|nr:unnamed protein product [Penicillium camemberti]
MLSTANLAGGGDALMLFRPSSMYYAGELETNSHSVGFSLFLLWLFVILSV